MLIKNETRLYATPAVKGLIDLLPFNISSLQRMIDKPFHSEGRGMNFRPPGFKVRIVYNIYRGYYNLIIIYLTHFPVNRKHLYNIYTTLPQHRFKLQTYQHLTLRREHTVLQPFRRIKLIVHIAISVLPGTHVLIIFFNRIPPFSKSWIPPCACVYMWKPLKRCINL